MRGAEIVIGSLLVVSGALGPVAGALGDVGLWADASDAPREIHGYSSFAQANYTGDVEVQAADAALRLKGPSSIEWAVENASLSVYSYKRNGGYLSAAGYNLTVKHTDGQNVETQRYGNATVEIEGKENGTIYVWPNTTGAGGTLSVSLDADRRSRISASAHGMTFRSPDDAHRYWLPGPVFGLGHEDTKYHQAQAAPARFDSFHANGAIKVVVDRSMLTITHGDGRDTYETGSEESHHDTVRPVPMQKRTYAVLTLPDANLTVPSFADLRAHLFAHQPEWRIDGTVSFTGQDGQASMGNRSEMIRDDRLRIEGNTTLDLRAEGAEDGTQLSNGSWGLRPEVLPDPTIHAWFDGQAEQVEVNGRTWETPSSPTVPEEVSLLSRVVGIAVLIWAVGKKLVFGLLALFNGDPLENPRRRRIVELLEDVGVANVRGIHEETGIPLGSVVYHLEILQKANLVASVNRTNYRAYFLPRPDLTRAKMQRLSLLAEDTRRSIAEHLVEEQGQTQQDLADALGLTQGTISRQLCKLVEAGLVQRETGERYRYSPSQLLRKWVGGTSQHG